MITCTQLVDVSAIQHIREDYLRTLSAPMDGMWESTAIEAATFWELVDAEQHIGHFCLDSNNTLLRFHLLEAYQAQAREIFRWLISTYAIKQAIASTIEQLYISVCLALQSSTMLHTYLFQDKQRMGLVVWPDHMHFRPAEESELAHLLHFYRTNTEGAGEWIEAFLHARLTRAELFVLCEGQTLLATGERIPSQRQPPYADLGMVVARTHRGQGLGSSMLMQLKQHCYQAGWKPICSCAADNMASKKAIEKAGFTSVQSMFEITFPS